MQSARPGRVEDTRGVWLMAKGAGIQPRNEGERGGGLGAEGGASAAASQLLAGRSSAALGALVAIGARGESIWVESRSQTRVQGRRAEVGLQGRGAQERAGGRSARGLKQSEAVEGSARLGGSPWHRLRRDGVRKLNKTVAYWFTGGNDWYLCSRKSERAAAISRFSEAPKGGLLSKEAAQV